MLGSNLNSDIFSNTWKYTIKGTVDIKNQIFPFPIDSFTTRRVDENLKSHIENLVIKL